MSGAIPLVLKLQTDAIDRNIPVSNLLRTAKLIASKLELEDALVWIDRELKGYMGLPSDDLPPYRWLTGEPKGWNPIQGRWLPIFFNNTDHAKKLSRAPIGMALGSIEQSLRDETNGVHIFPYPPELKAHVMKAIGEQTEIGIHLDDALIWNILDQVRNLIIDWTIELEQAGVLGEDMTFTVEEKNDAAPVTHQFFAQNISIVGNVSGQARATIRQSVNTGLDLDQVRELVGQIRGVLRQIPEKARENLKPEVENLETELANDEPDETKIRGLLRSIKTISEGAVGNLAAQGIIGLIASILG